MKKRSSVSREEMIIISLLMVISLLMIIFKGALEVYIIAGVIIFLGIYIWCGYICNVFSITKFKDRYWLNWYSPMGNFENMLLLPIIYIILVLNLAHLFIYRVIDFNIIIMVVVAIYLIIYDFVYKIKKKRSIDGEVDDGKLLKSYKIFINGIKIFAISIINIIFFWLFIKTKGIEGKVIFLPFLLCVICLFWQIISRVIGNAKLVGIFRKLFVVIFLMYWFVVIGFGLYSSIVNKEYSMMVFMVPFIIAGIFVGYKYFGKKK